MSDQNPFIQEMAYEKFKLFWMLRHGHSLSEFALRLLEVNEERTLEQWEADEGFSGEIWPCFEEFLQTEYLDGSLMALLMNQTVAGCSSHIACSQKLRIRLISYHVISQEILNLAL